MEEKKGTAPLKPRDSFTSKWGFIMAAVGSAVGMANVWAFPYRTAKYGGASFLIPYLICLVILMVTGVSAEIAFGRWGKTGPVGTFRRALTMKNKSLKEIGWIPVIGIFGIGTGYAVIMGWVLRYLWGSISGAVMTTQNTGAYFGAICGPFGSLPWHLVALAIAFVIMIAGVSKGIEKVSKVMMPLFYVCFIYMAIRVAFIPGATEGYKYLFVPDWKFMADPKTWMFALGQCFFSLSLGGAGTLVYGSYFSEKEDVINASINIAVFDTLAALLAALVVIPAVFAFKFDLASGPPLMFITLPAIFQEMAGGQIFAIIFFVAIFFAAVTSIINLFEPPIEALVQKLNMKRTSSIAIVAGLATVIGLFLENADLIGGWMDLMSVYVVPFGAAIVAIIFFWVMDKKFVLEQYQLGRKKSVPEWLYPLGKYVFSAIAILVVVLGIVFGGIG
jgi:NSS family neurotransmitter:Na+ symporter